MIHFCLPHKKLMEEINTKQKLISFNIDFLHPFFKFYKKRFLDGNIGLTKNFIYIGTAAKKTVVT